MVHPNMIITPMMIGGGQHLWNRLMHVVWISGIRLEFMNIEHNREPA